MAKCPTDTIAAGRAGVHRRAERQPQGRRAPRRRQAAVRPEGHRRQVQGAHGHPAGQASGVPSRHGRRAVEGRKGGKPVLGLFAPGNVPVEWTGKAAAKGGTEPQRCTTSNPGRPAARPPCRTRRARPSSCWRPSRRRRSSKRGFFLQIEGASIDKQDHAADPCGQIGETGGVRPRREGGPRLRQAHPDTLVVTTADHAHTSQIINAADIGAGARPRSRWPAPSTCSPPTARPRPWPTAPPSWPGRSSTPARSCGSPATARVPPTWSGSRTRPTSSTPSRARSAASVSTRPRRRTSCTSPVPNKVCAEAPAILDGLEAKLKKAQKQHHQIKVAKLKGRIAGVKSLAKLSLIGRRRTTPHQARGQARVHDPGLPCHCVAVTYR